MPYGNYTLLAPPGFTYHGKVTYHQGFYMSSNRIQIVKEGSLYEDEVQFLSCYLWLLEWKKASFWSNEVCIWLL